MGCNCKKKANLEKKYGTSVGENILKKGARFVSRLCIMAIATALALVITPILIILSFFKATIGNGKITLPKFLGKYLRDTKENGQELQSTN